MTDSDLNKYSRTSTAVSEVILFIYHGAELLKTWPETKIASWGFKKWFFTQKGLLLNEHKALFGP